MLKRPVGRPREPVTADEIEEWFVAELKEVAEQHARLRERLRRAQLAASIVEELAEVYKRVAKGELRSIDQAGAIYDVFIRQCVQLTELEVAQADVHRLAVEDAGGAVKMATRFVSQATGVSIYAIRAQRRPVQTVDTLLRVVRGG